MPESLVVKMYCVQCKKDIKHVVKINGNSWHHYCAECGIRFFSIDKRSINKASTQKQIKSWIGHSQTFKNIHD